MKFCQTKRKNKIIVLFIFIILFFCLYFNQIKVLQASPPVAIVGKVTCEAPNGDTNQAEDAIKEKISLGTEIKTVDLFVAGKIESVNCTDKRGWMERFMDHIMDINRQDLWKALEASTALAYKKMLEAFLNNLAIDTATYLATGDNGQQPMFITEGWGEYLKNTADNAAGTFLETLGRDGPIKFNLCSPNADVMLKINLGIGRQFRPKIPSCTFSKLIDNWDAALNDKDFLPKFQDMFNPWSNDLGIALTLQTGMESEISRQVNEAAQEGIKDIGFKAVLEPISKKIKTPAKLVRDFAGKPVEDANKNYFVYTGNAIADSIDIFINTLIGKLIDKWLRQGLVTDFPANTNRFNNLGPNSLTDPNAQKPDEGIAGAEGRFKSLVEPNFKVRADYNILAELTMCPDPTKAGPTNCVIDEKFREAIEKRLTVGQALKQGYLSNTAFGFLAAGSRKNDTPEPMYNEGYPYRSMLILRKFRIIPIGWEIAAQKINEVASSAHTLGYLVDCFSGDDEYGAKDTIENWCAGLVDPNWVLKAPQNFCKKEGPGPEILSEQVTGQGAGSSLSILRNDNYCADEQSVVKERSDGSNVYGYCTEERRLWDFNGKSCAPRDNTCQTFQLGDQTVSYLQNTLDFSVCNAGNVGCKKYATNGSYVNGMVDWNIANNNPVYLNKQAESCEAADQGCHGFIRIIPEKTETYTDIITAGIDKAYQRFSASGLIYEKLLPDYLEGVCYDNQGRLKISAPVQCANFVRQCKETEAGCELYTSATDGAKIPAKVAPNDYCPAECVGYDTFVQTETTFSSSRPAYFIPKTAKTCSAEATGCEQFTNLDEVKKGGEGIEYYTYLRQCLDKAAPPAGGQENCGEFYSWEGSDESGYQLKVESLKINGAEPAITENDSALCDKRIYNLPLSDPAHNSDCRQFYNNKGDISYHLYRRTISCSDNCHPYRKTVAADDPASSCYGGGVWDDSNKACIYMAIPGQGASCSATQNGCREYNGNTGNDLRNIFTDDFSGGTTANWDGVGGSAVVPSSEALTLDADNKGNSLKVTGSPFSAGRTVGTAVTQGKSYVLSFLAKADAKTNFNISLAAGALGAKAAFAQIKDVDTDWQIYKTNLAKLNHKVTADEFLLIEASQNFYIDNITLTEIVDRYYLIKDSWNTPLTCDSNQSDNLPGEALGCDQYANRANKTHYLKSFNKLCSESAVGCELMIDTKNSTATTTETFSNDGTTMTVPADEFTYVVYDPNKLCSKEAKGCALLGQPYTYENNTFYSDVYLKNNPDKYNQILCGADAVGCQAFAYDNGVKSGEKYFKDPGLQACEWRQEPNTTAGPRWLKKKVKRCDNTEHNVCLTDTNCSIVASNIKCDKDEDCGAKNKCVKPQGELKGVCHNSCITDKTDYTCPTDETKTLGKGGAGGQVSQPAGKPWAGICAAANSGCSEYIDPISRFNANIIFNGSFQKLAVNKWDGWEVVSGDYKQSVTLEPNTVYRLARLKKETGKLEIKDCKVKVNNVDVSISAFYEINQDNNLIGPASSIPIDAANYANSKIFYYRGNDQANCTITAGSSDGAVELKKAIVDYQLAQNLDIKSCNGVVDFNNGCVLFNQRNYDLASLKKLDSDADIVNFSSPALDADKDSNIILKVTPDRVCDKWLACRSYVKDEKGNQTCYGVGLCDAVDDKGDCTSFISSAKANQAMGNLLDAEKISNLSGYAKVGLAGGSLGGDYYPLGAMEQKGEVANLANGGFEFYGANDYPIGWTWGGQTANNKPWDVNIFSVINNPIAAQTEGIGYAREGRAFLKLGSSYDATSEETDVMPNTDYIITAYVNTKNLKSGQARIDIINDKASSPAVITQDIGNDWQFKVGKFFSGNNSKIKIKLYASLSGGGNLKSSEGNFYFDDIKIKPALESKCKDNCADKINYNPWYTSQSCRLYPKTDSLACDYFEDSGKRQKGWPGYCLEYDRPPGNPNTCILWYPVDRVKGDGLEEGANYLGKFPVYYCLSATSANSCSVSGEALIRCDKVVRTVNSIGQNKYWSSRVYQGTDWYTNNQSGSYINYDNTGLNKVYVGANNKQYNYGYDQAPFGSIVPPSSATDNPFDWDSRAESGIQPLYLEVPPKGQSNLARAGSPFYCNADQSCYLIEFHDGRPPVQINSLDVQVFMSAVGVYSLSFNGVSFTTGTTMPMRLNIGNNNVYLYSDAKGGTRGKGQCTNLMEAYIVLPNGEKAVLTKAGNETETGATPIINCVGNTVDGGIKDYAGGEFRTTFKVAYNDRKECKVNITDGEARGIDSIKNLFAQSYGAWEWDNNGVCASGVKAGKSCTDNNACQGGSCSGRCVDTRTNSVTPNLCVLGSSVTTSCNALDKGVCKPVNTNICFNSPSGNKNFSACVTIAASSAECKGCAGQTFGTCNSVSYCQGGVRDGQTCNRGDSGFCNNYSAGYNNGSCNDTDPDPNITTLKCVGGNKDGASCTINTCQADSYGIKTCVSGSKAGKYCNNDDSCNDCKGSAGSTYGVCESLGQCQNGARNGLICNLSQGNNQCNSTSTNLADSNCANYNIGSCVQKQACNAGCNKDEICNSISNCVQKPVCDAGCYKDEKDGTCNSNSGFCNSSTQCHQCLPSFCSDNKTSCSSDANCSGACGGSIGYKKVDQPTWGPPGANGEAGNGLCNNGVRQIGAYCAILPLISNIKVQDLTGGLIELAKNSQFINLTFNSKVDSNQLPLVMYAIDWGDNEKTVMTGAEMRDRPDPDPSDPNKNGNPHSLYHLYSYWDLKTKANSGSSNIDCSVAGQCKITPKIQIKDNWGWCNLGQTINVCGDGQWDSFKGTIVVKEK